MIIYCLNIAKIPEVPIEELRLMVSEERRKKADCKKNLSDKYRCIYTELFLKYVLADNGNKSENFRIHYNECDKPYLDEINFFNISHAGDWIVIAFGKSEIGIDIEKIKTGRDRFVETVFKDIENDYVNSFPEYEHSRYFTQIWTLKESYVKYLGKSILSELKNFSIDPVNKKVITCNGKIVSNLKLDSILFDDDYYLSFCSKENVSEIKNVYSEDLSRTQYPWRVKYNY